MPGEALQTLLVCVQNRLIGLRLLLRQPCKQRRAEIETDVRVIICNFNDVSVAVQNPRHAVRRVAFGSDALIPVVERISGVLHLNEFEPGVLSRRLVKVAVDTDIAFHSVLNFFFVQQHAVRL